MTLLITLIIAAITYGTPLLFGTPVSYTHLRAHET